MAFAEGEEERVLRAVQIVVDEGLARPTLIGRPAIIAQRIEKFGLRLKEELDYDIVNVEQDHRYRDFWQTYHRMTERMGQTVQTAKIEMRRRLTLIGSMLLHKGEVDGLICGTWGTTQTHLPYIDQVIGKRAGTPQDVPVYACMNGLLLPDRQAFLVDTHVNYDAANISYNLLKTAAGGNISIGPVLLGAAKPVHILTPSATVRRIVNMTALTVADANAARTDETESPGSREFA